MELQHKLSRSSSRFIHCASFVVLPRAQEYGLSSHPALIERLVDSDTSLPLLLSTVFISDPLTTTHGQVDIYLLPILDLFRNRAYTARVVAKSVEQVVEAKPDVVSCSFTGMIPAALNYMQDVYEHVGQDPQRYPMVAARLKQGKLALTSGHDAVSAAFVINIQGTLEQVGRRYESEYVAFIGLGSIGSATWKLLMTLPQFQHPQVIILIDTRQKLEYLNTLKEQIQKNGYDGPVSCYGLGKDQPIPKEVYQTASLFCLATSEENVLDIDQVQPGCIIVDDSWPLGYEKHKAFHRMKVHSDIIISTAGGIKCPSVSNSVYPSASAPELFPPPMSYQVHSTGSKALDSLVEPLAIAGFISDDQLTGCIYASFLTPLYHLPGAVGPLSIDQVRRVYQVLLQHKYGATQLYVFNAQAKFGKTFLNDQTEFPALLDRFTQRYGDHTRAKPQTRTHSRRPKL